MRRPDATGRARPPREGRREARLARLHRGLPGVVGLALRELELSFNNKLLEDLE